LRGDIKTDSRGTYLLVDFLDTGIGKRYIPDALSDFEAREEEIREEEKRIYRPSIAA